MGADVLINDITADFTGETLLIAIEKFSPDLTTIKSLTVTSETTDLDPSEFINTVSNLTSIERIKMPSYGDIWKLSSNPTIYSEWSALPLRIIDVGSYVYYSKDTYFNQDTLEEIYMTSKNENEPINLTGYAKLIKADFSAADYCIYFTDCINLVYIKINPTSIRSKAFMNCHKLAVIEIYVSKDLEVSAEAFTNCYNLTTLPFEISAVGSYSFANCTSLVNLSVKDNFYVSSHCFEGCTSLKALYRTTSLIADLVSIAEYAFKDCVSFDTLGEGSNMKIGKYAFQNAGFEQITISGVPNFDEGAFYGCKKLVSFSAQSVNDLPNKCFMECSKLSSFTLNQYGQTFGESAFEGTALTKPVPAVHYQKRCFARTHVKDVVIDDTFDSSPAEELFAECTELKTFRYPASPSSGKSLLSIGERCFAGCVNLISFEMTNSSPDLYINEIGIECFKGCTNLMTFNSTCQMVDDGAFSGCKNLREFRFDSISSIGKYAFEGTSIDEFSCESEFTMGEGSFKDCLRLSSFKFAGGMDIPDYCFSGCRALDALEGQILSIGREAFSNTRIETINTAKCTVIHYGAFNNSRIIQIDMPAVTTLEKGAFLESKISTLDAPLIEKVEDEEWMAGTALETVILPKVNVLPARAFADCESLRCINASNVYQIGDSVFSGCTGLVTLSLGDIDTIADGLFEGCTKLETFTSKVRSIGARGFKGCTSLREIDVSELQSLGDEGFSGCSFVELDFPSLSSVGKGAFSGCEFLQSVTGLPDISSVPDTLFCNCVSLETVNGKASIEPTKIGSSSLENCKKLTISTDKLQEIGDRGLYGCLITRASINNAGDFAFGCCVNLKEVELRSATISNGLFFECGNLSVIKGTFEIIGDYAFKGCVSLVGFDFSSYKSIGAHSFEDCVLESVTFGTVSIGERAFDGTMLKKIEGKSITLLDNALSGMSTLEQFSSEKVPKVGQGAFAECTSITELAIMGCESIGSEAFTKCKELKTLTTDAKELIGDAHFAEDGKLEIIDLSSLEKVDPKSALIFKQCKSISKISLGEAPPKTFNKDVFDGLKFELGLPDGKFYEVYDNNTDVEGDVPGDKKWCGIDLYYKPSPGGEHSNTVLIVTVSVVGGVVVIAAAVAGLIYYRQKRYALHSVELISNTTGSYKPQDMLGETLVVDFNVE